MKVRPKHVEQRLSTSDRYRFALSRARGIPIETDLSRYDEIIDRILDRDFRTLPDVRIGILAAQAADRLRAGARAPAGIEALSDAMALASEAAWRVLGERPYPVQLVTALALNEGKLAQMATGEGKTLAAVPAAYLAAQGGNRCHVLTANDYLARRDAGWMADVYRMLGRTVSFVNDDTPDHEKPERYRADITYLTPRRAGFDFLTDQLALDPSDRVQTPFSTAIVDEADSLLIDESRIPLVIARDSEAPRQDPMAIDDLVQSLEPDLDFTRDKTARRCVLTPRGHETVRRRLNCPGIDEPDGLPWYAAVNVSLHAHHLLSRDVDYIVRDGAIELVDGFTGRVADRRRWPDGIQSALEAKERVSIRSEGQIYGSITVQHFVGRYPRLAGMTATATPSARELHEFYGLSVVVVPGNRESRLVREPDRVFTTRAAKYDAVAERVLQSSRRGQPVLVGTWTVRESEELARLLRDRGVKCVVLNARNDEEEAGIIAEAGRAGAVTISTNMAGRGTDIHLGGADQADHDRVVSLGGLCVIGTNRHESSRIDEQLAGRAGRQGDPGQACAYVSLEDDLVERYAITDLLPPEHLLPGDREIRDPRVSREIVRAQSIIEEQHFVMRRTLRTYSELIERRRREFEALRDATLFGHQVPAELIRAVTPDGGDDAIDSEALAICFMQAMDAAWSEFLEWAGALREGIHLRRYSGRAPILEFVEAASEEYEEVLTRAINGASGRYRNWIAADDRERTRLMRPASTWTYLISDNPFPNFSVAGLAGGNVMGALYGALFGPFLGLERVVRRLLRRSG